MLRGAQDERNARHAVTVRAAPLQRHLAPHRVRLQAQGVEWFTI